MMIDSKFAEMKTFNRNFKDSITIINNYQTFCVRLLSVAHNFGVNNANLFTTKSLATCRIESRTILGISDFIEDLIRQRQKESNVKLIHPQIDRKPLYQYNRLQWRLREYMGKQRILMLMGVSRKSTIFKNLLELSVSPKEIVWILDLINRKGIQAATTGFDHPIIRWYFENLIGHRISCCTPYQMEISFKDLRNYKMALRKMPNYFELSTSKISSIFEISGISKRLLKHRIRQREFNVQEVRTLIEMIRLLTPKPRHEHVQSFGPNRKPLSC